MDDKLVRMSDVERWILTESACIDTPADRDAVVERMRYSIPAVDAVEVVRCRKCKMWTPINDEESYGWCSLDCKATRKAMHFCGYGKRREEGD